MRKILFAIFFVELFCALIIIVFIHFHHNSGAFTPTLRENTSLVLIGSEYKTVRDELVSLVTQQNPRTAIAALKAQMAVDPKVLASCHELLHEIGRASYRKYNNFAQAMLYRDDMCVSGYTHGVIEAYFANSRHSLRTLPSLCESYPDGKYLRWECSHGMGHGLMFASNNTVPWALTQCEKLHAQFDQEACANGVYMQNFNADSDDHPSNYVSFSDPFQACRLPSNYLGDCYANAPLYYLNYRPNDVIGALQWCNSVPILFRGYCYFGVGNTAAKFSLQDAKSIVSVCTSGKGQKADMCIAGMITWYIDYYASLAPAEKICQQVPLPEQKICQETIQANAVLF